MDTFTTINAGSSTDGEKLTQLIDLLAQARVYMLEHFDAELPIDQLFSPYSEHEDHLRVAYEKVFIQQRMLARNNASVLQSEVDARIDRLEISGNHAEADVYELYTYTRSETPQFQSAEGLNYKYSFEKIGGEWYFDDITSDDPEDAFIASDSFDADEYVAYGDGMGGSASMEDYLGITKGIYDEGDINAISGLTKTAIDVDRVAEYANRYAIDYNGLFFSYKGYAGMGDCQNFASQSIWYGLGGSNSASAIANKQWPMIDDRSDGRGWFQLHEYVSDSGHHWPSVVKFAQYISESSSSTYGLRGTVTSGIATASYGDIIQVGNSESGYYHSYIVVAHSGSSGSRTADNLWVAGHTEDMNYKHFSDVYSSSKYYRTIHITGSYR